MRQLRVRKTGIFSETPLSEAQPEVPMRRPNEDNQHLLIWRTEAWRAREGLARGLEGSPGPLLLRLQRGEEKAGVGSWGPGPSHPVGRTLTTLTDLRCEHWAKSQMAAPQ